MNRRQLLIVAVLILVPTFILFLVSYFVQPVLPPPWNNVLILLGVVLGATLAALSAFNDIFQLVDRFTGREEFDSDSQELRMVACPGRTCALEYLTQVMAIYEGANLVEVEGVGGRVAKQQEYCLTEEATKNAMVRPEGDYREKEKRGKGEEVDSDLLDLRI